MKDVFKQRMNGIYGWSVDEGKVKPPVHTFPRAVKERADYFLDMAEDGMTFMGVLECIFADEKPDDYDFGATKEWLDKSSEFKQWEDESPRMSQMEIAVYSLFPLWKEETDV